MKGRKIVKLRTSRRGIELLIVTLIVGGSLILVFQPLDAGEGPNDLPKRPASPEEFRAAAPPGDLDRLEVLKTRRWNRVGGTVTFEDSAGGSPAQFNVAVWEDGFTIYWEGKLQTAVIDRVMTTFGHVPLDDDSGATPEGGRAVFDHRFKECPTRAAPSEETGEIYDVGGAPLVVPLPGELDNLTNDGMINDLIAPSHWTRSILELQAQEVRDEGTEEVAGRQARKLVIPLDVEPDDGRTITETVWVDTEMGVVLRRIRSGFAPPTPDADEARPLRQEWRFTDISFDEDVEVSALGQLTLSSGEGVLYRAFIEHEDRWVENRETLERDTDVMSIVERYQPSADPIANC